MSDINISNFLFYLILILLLPTIITFIIKKIRARSMLRELLKSGMHSIDKMDGFQFEYYLTALFKELGYNAQVTKKSGDFGADLVLKGKDKIVIQAKRYGYKNKVSLSAIQEIYAAKAYYKADEAWVLTNSHFTKRAIELAEACQVKLLNRYDLQDFINSINPTETAEHVYQSIDPKARKCPNCGELMMIRKNEKLNERFFGCSAFPACRHTEPIKERKI